MSSGGRFAALGLAALVTACLLTSCGSGPTAAQKKAVRDILTTTTTKPPPTTTVPSSTTTSMPGVAIPNVIGLKIAAARAALRAAGFTSVNLNTPCNKGSLASQSVVASLAIPGKAPNVTVGAVPLSPGVTVSPGTRLGITWTGCDAGTPEVPAVVGLSFPAARRAIHGAGLTWACFSVGKPATTTTTTTDQLVTSTTVKVVQTVLTQTPAPHTVLQPGATVTLTMHHCPQ